MATHTWTIDTASSPWFHSDGLKTTVSGTAQTMTLTCDDTGDGGNFYSDGNDTDLLLADGSTLRIHGDPQLTFFVSGTDAAAKINPGSIWVSVDGGLREEVKIVSLTMADADSTGANNITSITFEYPGKPYQWTWTNIKTA